MFGEAYSGDFQSDPATVGNPDPGGTSGSESEAGSGNSGNGGSGSNASAAGEDWSGVDFNGWGFPVVLDLDGDGQVEILPLSKSTARFDIDGDGHQQVVAWIGKKDGLLVYDRDGDRLISHKDEIAFRDYLATAKTDLEGLAWFDQFAQGGNEDGVLDERDAEWSKFGVWRDADQDGETDPGELRMTHDGGLQSVDLTSDQEPVDVGPDAKVFGQGTYEYLDGDGIRQEAVLFDTALRYAEESENTKPADLPTLARLDGQPLQRHEILYPAMCYRENIHEPWPAWAIEQAAKKYPDLPGQIKISRTLAKACPENLRDPDYHPLPDNPSFQDVYRNGLWKEKHHNAA